MIVQFRWRREKHSPFTGYWTEENVFLDENVLGVIQKRFVFMCKMLNSEQPSKVIVGKMEFKKREGENVSSCAIVISGLMEQRGGFWAHTHVGSVLLMEFD